MYIFDEGRGINLLTLMTKLLCSQLKTVCKQCAITDWCLRLYVCTVVYTIRTTCASINIVEYSTTNCIYYCRYVHYYILCVLCTSMDVTPPSFPKKTKQETPLSTPRANQPSSYQTLDISTLLFAWRFFLRIFLCRYIYYPLEELIIITDCCMLVRKMLLGVTLCPFYSRNCILFEFLVLFLY